MPRRRSASIRHRSFDSGSGSRSKSSSPFDPRDPNDDDASSTNPPPKFQTRPPSTQTGTRRPTVSPRLSPPHATLHPSPSPPPSPTLHPHHSPSPPTTVATTVPKRRRRRYSDAEQRKEDARTQRMNAEQRRRDLLRDGYDRLQSVLPQARDKLSKVRLIESGESLCSLLFSLPLGGGREQ